MADSLIQPCGSIKPHEAHNGCPGGIACDFCSNVIRRDQMIDHMGDHLKTVQAIDHKLAAADVARSKAQDADVPEDLVLTERASGAPVVQVTSDGYVPRGFALLHGLIPAVEESRQERCPKLGCQLTHPHLHSRSEIDGQRGKVIGCPDCGYGTPSDDEIWDHLVKVHGWKGDMVKAYMNDLVLIDADEVCTHPNGFGPMGCPCGAPQPPDDADDLWDKRNGITTERHPCPRIDTHVRHLWQPNPMGGEFFSCIGRDVATPAVINSTEVGECSVCHARSVRVTGDIEIWWHEAGNSNNACRRQGAVFVPEGDMACPVGCGTYVVKGDRTILRQHLQTEHSWTGDLWADWSERNPAPSVPDPVLAAMDAAVRADEFARKFLDPTIPDQEVLQVMDLDPETTFPEASDLEKELTAWWLDRASEEASAVVPKAVEYGSNSLMQVGRKMAQLQGRTVTDEEALELGCWSYAIGKVERWTDAVMRGDRPSDDTIHDIGIYVKMAQRIRAVGSWPGLPTDND